jgi:hypothetical protein
MARTGCLVCFISSVNGRSKKEEEKNAIKTALVRGHITNLKQSRDFRLSMVKGQINGNFLYTFSKYLELLRCFYEDMRTEIFFSFKNTVSTNSLTHS